MLFDSEISSAKEFMLQDVGIDVYTICSSLNFIADKPKLANLGWKPQNWQRCCDILGRRMCIRHTFTKLDDRCIPTTYNLAICEVAAVALSC